MPALPFVRSEGSAIEIAIEFRLRFADLALRLAFQFFRGALELFAVIVGGVADILANLAGDFLRRALVCTPSPLLQAQRCDTGRARAP